MAMSQALLVWKHISLPSFVRKSWTIAFLSTTSLLLDLLSRYCVGILLNFCRDKNAPLLSPEDYTFLFMSLKPLKRPVLSCLVQVRNLPAFSQALEPARKVEHVPLCCPIIIVLGTLAVF